MKGEPGSPRSGVLERVLAISARRVLPGGEHGWWRWLVPMLLVSVVGLAVAHVNAVGDRSRTALDAATSAQQLLSATNQAKALEAARPAGRRAEASVSNDLEAAALQMRDAAAGLRDKQSSDTEASLLAGRSLVAAAAIRRFVAASRSAGGRTSTRLHQRTPRPNLDLVTPLATSVGVRLAAEATRADAHARSQSTLSLLAGLLVVVFLMWIFWAKRNAAQAAVRERRSRALWKDSSDLLLVVDSGGEVLHATPAVERILGHSPDDLPGTPFSELVHPEDRHLASAALRSARTEPEATSSAKWRVLREDGGFVDVEGTCVNLLEDPSVGGFVVTLRDVGERKDLENQLRHQAFHDSLTGLPNRALFEDRVRHGVARTFRGSHLAVLFVDLDDFKTVNDSLGHAAGDELLCQVATRLDGCTRGSDTAARLGGDEFAVVVETGGDPAETAVEVADRIHESLKKPFQVAGDEIFVHASIGIAMGDTGTSTEDLLRNADTAMYAAKASGKGCSEIFRATMHLAAQKRFQLTGDLRRAVRDGQFTVHYQPLVDLKSKTVLGLEALVRWDHPTLGQIPPADFIPLAEETGLIIQIGRFVLEEACRQRQAWVAKHPTYDQLYISVNLSTRQFKPAGQIVQDVREATERTGFDPSLLVLEVTESILMGDRESITRDLQALRALGIRIAIDDFGTGYSALSYLREFPVDSVKMDRSFVRDLACGTGDAALVRSVLELGEALDMQIIAEGIEDENQLTSLSDLSCSVGQGFYFAPPMDADDVSALLSTGNMSPPSKGAAAAVPGTSPPPSG
jgi:diguanylate cyclase (GGDEF)-like protein/PAS domain S-box-containing protein